ncbi:hypothetical protein IL54_0302 [Sphingobium sp. ba1]|nr:hypothetical protein IL54_0302 [Sphingobium sp. ba1]
MLREALIKAPHKVRASHQRA